MICIFFYTSVQAKSFTINVVETYQGHTDQKTLEYVYQELYAPLGITPKLVYYPSKRGLLLVNQGVLDAEAGRFELAAQQYPNLMKINESMNISHSGVYCLSKDSCELSKNVTIVALTSFRSAQSFCTSKKTKCHFESEPIAIAQMLDKGVAKAFLSSTLESYKVLCALKTEKLFFHKEPSLTRSSFHFVHQRHAKLIPQLEHSIRQLKLKGLLPASNLDDTPDHSSCGKSIVSV